MKIIFENLDKTIGIIHPTNEGLNVAGIEALAKKDTPAGLPFWIVEDDSVSSDREFRNVWELDGTQGEPDGHGSESHQFEEI